MIEGRVTSIHRKKQATRWGGEERGRGSDQTRKTLRVVVSSPSPPPLCASGRNQILGTCDRIEPNGLTIRPNGLLSADVSTQ